MRNTIWFLKGLRNGKKTELFPEADPLEPPLWPSMLEGKGEVECPTKALENGKWNAGKCIACRRCIPQYMPTGNQKTYSLSKFAPSLLSRSFYLYPVDSGTCGACNTELLSILSPQYDASRLNIFLTNTPRHADALVIMGVYTEGMDDVVSKAYEAMPDPKLIITLGACAISGGVIGKAPVLSDKATVEIAGCPPSPYTILEAIVKAKGGGK
ncbi:NADH ubiquinone oxidoreductase, 20 kDa subunit [mine drainage metagenome]|uniref:NADH ubiquinone oxidoreductase, 20 kDa subunit n=1 Tax=mine drainage metagenome TaxID=410659 RepID=T0YYZ8_9ZZZZ